MLHCKIVTVYTGRAENSIQGIEIAAENDVISAAQYTNASFIANMVKEGCTMEQAAEFAGVYVADELHAYVNAGEENVKLVLNCSSPWYHVVDVHPDWTELQYNDWNEFLYALELASADYHYLTHREGTEW